MFGSIFIAGLLLASEASLQQWVCARPSASTPAARMTSAMLTYNPVTLTFSFKTKDATATGMGQLEAGFYRGRLTTENGAAFDFSLDRATGDFKLSRLAEAGSTAHAADYSGRCTETRSLPPQ